MNTILIGTVTLHSLPQRLEQLVVTVFSPPHIGTK